MIQRLPGKNRYLLTPRGIRWALFLTKVYSRIVRPFSRSQDPPPIVNPSEIDDGFRALDAALEKIIQNAGLSPGFRAKSRLSPAASRQPIAQAGGSV